MSGESAQETLSAMLDDEAQDLEVRRLLRDLSGDDQRRWERFHLARAALRGETPRAPGDFVASLSARLAAEGVSPGQTQRDWRRAVGGLAVAASVAAVVVFGGQLYQERNPALAGSSPGVGALPVGVVNTVGTRPVQASFGGGGVPALEPAERTAYRELARQRLRRYSLEHAEHAALNTPGGMVPFGRVPVIGVDDGAMAAAGPASAAPGTEKAGAGQDAAAGRGQSAQ